MGITNPFLFNVLADDFNNPPAATWTATSAALTALDGGVVQLTGTAASLAKANNSFGYTAGMKMFFFARFTLTAADMTTPVVNIGFANAATGITDGIYLSKLAGSNALSLNVEGGGASTVVPIPYTGMTTATSYDAGIELTTQGDVCAYFSTNLAGWIPQSGTGGSTPARGKIIRINKTQYPMMAFPTILMGPVISLGGTGGTLNVDFVLAAKER
jgi:hypothetical protein